VCYLIDFLMHEACYETDIFRLELDRGETKTIYKAMKACEPVDLFTFKRSSAAIGLKTYLMRTPPLFPTRMFFDFINIEKNQKRFEAKLVSAAALVQTLSPQYRTMLTIMFDLFKAVVARRKYTHMNAKLMAHVWGPVLFRPPDIPEGGKQPTIEQATADIAHANALLVTMIHGSDQIFGLPSKVAAVPERIITHCMLCHKQFGAFTGKEHCIRCGKVCCSKCVYVRADKHPACDACSTTGKVIVRIKG
jgi:hypothetical protein